MDYKKKYENALEWARQVINGECGFIRKELEEVFPELKESEDERIRKGMLQGFKDYGEPEYVWWEGVKVKECIAWLEKQGQSKKTSIWKHWKDGIAGNGDGIPVFLIKNGSTYSLSSCLGFECDYIELSELDNLMLEKQGEQNYEFNGIAESRPAKGKLKELYEGLCQSKETKKSDQGWSDEDEERYKSCLKRLGTGNEEQPDTINTVWFKALKQRLLWQEKKK